MASFLATTKACKYALIYTILFITLATMHVSCFQYEVGGEKSKGWMEPDGSEAETYNEWAQQNRFHIGDSIHFKYTKDSVLQVERKDYATCNVTAPLSKFDDGNTVFKFDDSGFFYFISGEPGHCQSGQKMIVRVMVQSGSHESPGPATSADGPSGAGDGAAAAPWGSASTNSTDLLSVTSYFLTLFIGVVVVLYLFMD